MQNDKSRERYMTKCIQLAKKSKALGNAPVGSILVKGDSIIGEGLELGKTKNDITFHAEIEAIREGLKATKNNTLSGCTLYTTHEPCLMCSYVIRHYGIEKVYFGISTGEIGGYSSDFKILEAREIDRWTKPPMIISGFMFEECEALNQKSTPD